MCIISQNTSQLIYLHDCLQAAAENVQDLLQLFLLYKHGRIAEQAAL